MSQTSDERIRVRNVRGFCSSLKLKSLLFEFDLFFGSSEVCRECRFIRTTDKTILLFPTLFLSIERLFFMATQSSFLCRQIPHPFQRIIPHYLFVFVLLCSSSLSLPAKYFRTLLVRIFSSSWRS